MSHDTTGGRTDATQAEWVREAEGRRRHHAGDLETLAHLAAEFAAGTTDDDAGAGSRPNETVVWYGRDGAVAVLDDRTRHDTVSCPLAMSYQMQALRVLDRPGPFGGPLTQRQALRVLCCALYRSDAEGAIDHVRSGDGGALASFSIQAPYWEAYPEGFQMKLVVERIGGDAPLYLIAPAGGEINRVDRLAAQRVCRRLREALDFHGAGEVRLLHGRP